MQQPRQLRVAMLSAPDTQLNAVSRTLPDLGCGCRHRGGGTAPC